MEVSCFVVGTPVAKGSMRIVRTARGPRLVSGSPALAEWIGMVQRAAQMHQPHDGPSSSAIGAALVFHLPRPKYHYRADGTVRDRYVDALPAKKPDIDKLTRAVLDAMTGILFLDDSQVVSLSASKIFGTCPGCHITIRTIAQQETNDGNSDRNNRRK